MRGYHGTSRANLEAILAEGLFPRGRLPGEEVCFVVPDEDMLPLVRAEAHQGDDHAVTVAADLASYASGGQGCVIEAELEGMDVRIFEAVGPEGSIWEARVKRHVPPERLQEVAT